MRGINSDTIAAIASPEGEGAICVIRISGENAFKIASNIFLPISKKRFNEFLSFHLYRGWIRDGKEEIDEVMMVIMQKPKSYTGEDMIEIYSHGGRAVVTSLLNVIISHGARLAEPGEFTRRAFLNGKMDLTQAESVAWIVAAKSESEVKSAARQLKGWLKDSLGKVKWEIIKALSLVEIAIDFEEYEEIKIPFGEMEEILGNSKKKMKEILKQARTGSYIRNGIKVVIVGKSNVGKSSLLNTFLKQKRAIVSKYPGTTRDTIEEVIRLDGIPLRIIDTAGIRTPRGEIEKEGVKRAKEKVRKADLVLMVLDSGTRISRDDLEILELVKDKRALIIINKTDMPIKVDLKEISHELKRRKIIKISATKNWGLERLKKEITQMIKEEFITEKSISVILSQRRAIALEKALRYIDNAIKSIRRRLSGEFIALDLQNALKQIKGIMGEECQDEVLDEIFSRFCVGK